MHRTRATIAIVVPWIHGLRGHRTSIVLARELANRGAEVDFFAGRVYSGSTQQVADGLHGVNLHVGKAIDSGETSVLKFVRYQYSRLLDRELAKAIGRRHAETPFDFVFVVSNEGHWLAGYLRSYLRPPQPTIALCLRELVEHPFWLGYSRPGSLARAFISPAYPLAHWVEAQRLRQFDLIFSNSPWTSTLLEYFYGIRGTHPFVAVDRAFFDSPLSRPETNYIAAPTASLDKEGMRLLQGVYERTPNLRTFGRTPVPGLPHEGFLPDAHLVSFLAHASATLFVFDYEALGLIPFESLAAGTPVATLPKQGPYAVLAGNPHVRFGETVEELSSALAELTRLASDADWRSGCRASVVQFRPDEAVDRWLDHICARTALGSKFAYLRGGRANASRKEEGAGSARNG